MSLNLDKNKDALVKAWREVLDEQNPTNWALFGYDGLSFDLNLISKGDGGLEELIDDFNSGKIMYALCRVKVKEKNIEKTVLINWQGEGAPLARKGTCANHLGHIKSFFKGVHVTINARADEDVEPSVIVKTVANATAGDGVQHSMSTDIEAQGVIGPIGTSYKKVNPTEDINTAAKDIFWRNEEQEEERRKRDEQHKLRKFSQNEVKLLRRESQEYFNSNSPIEAESKHSSYSTNQATPPSQSNGSPMSNSNSSLHSAAIKASTPMKNSNSGNSGDLVRQRIKSFDHGTPRTPVTSLTNPNTTGVNSGSGSDTGESLSVRNRRQIFEAGLSTPNYASFAAVKKDPAQEIKLAQEQEKIRQDKEKARLQEQEKVRLQEQEKIRLQEQERVRIQEQEKAQERARLQEQEKIRQQEQEKARLQKQKESQKVTPTPSTTSMPTSKLDNNSFDTRKINSSPIPPQSTSLPEQIVQKTASPSSFSPTPSPAPPAQAPVSPVPVTMNGNSTNSFQMDKQATSGMGGQKNGYGARHDDCDGDSSVQSAENFNKSAHVIENNGTSEREEDAATPTFVLLPEMGTCARALYDYQAADDSEVSFDPGDIITNIEQIDEGWWEGLGPHGVYGLFPANYVELVQE